MVDNRTILVIHLNNYYFKMVHHILCIIHTRVFYVNKKIREKHHNRLKHVMGTID